MKTQGRFLTLRIEQISCRIFEQMLQEYGIREFAGSRGKILYVTWECRKVPISYIFHRTSLARTTLTSMTDRIGGMVKRRQNSENRRKIQVSITPKARCLRKE